MHRKTAILLSSLLPAGLFLLSGIAKLWDTDAFQDYLFSTGMLHLNAAILAARVLISFELFIAVLLVLRLFPRPVSIISIAALLLFDIFLIHEYRSTNSSDCHCFGTLISLTPQWSLLKNILLQLLLAAYGYLNPAPILQRRKPIWLAVALSAVLILSFSLRFPLHRWNNQPPQHNYCSPCVNRFIKTQKLEHTKAVLCFFSTGCRYCRLATGRLSTIAAKSKHPERIQLALWDETQTAPTFFTQSNSRPFPFTILSEDTFLQLTLGQMPLIMLSDKGKIIRTYRYSDIDEDFILHFLNEAPTIP